MKEIDCLGEICPIPIIRIKEAMKTTKSGETIKVITDHSCVHQSVKDHFKNTKIVIEDEEVMNGVWEIFLTLP